MERSFAHASSNRRATMVIFAEIDFDADQDGEQNVLGKELPLREIPLRPGAVDEVEGIGTRPSDVRGATSKI